MLTQESFVEILILHRQGMGIKAIARQLGVSRNTIRKYLPIPNKLPAYSTRKARRTKLSDYQDFIK
jgi:transposase